MTVRSKLHDASHSCPLSSTATAHSRAHVSASVKMSTTSSEDSSPPSPAVAIASRLRYILSSVLIIPVDQLRPDTHLSSVGVDPLSAYLLAGLATKAGLPLSYADIISVATYGKLEALVRERIEAADADVWMEEHFNSHPFDPPESSA